MYSQGWANEVDEIKFQTLSGVLRVTKQGDLICMNFPLIPTQVATHPAYAEEILGNKVIQAAKLRKNWIFELADEEAVRSFQPDFAQIAANSEEGFVITAAGTGDYDLVSRFFGPNVGIPEDPVTGFAHCALEPENRENKVQGLPSQYSGRNALLGNSRRSCAHPRPSC
jgi:predicted PhzF superfamily epimerase YddE/YHI9